MACCFQWRVAAKNGEEFATFKRKDSQKFAVEPPAYSKQLPNHPMIGLNGFNIQTLRIRKGLKSKEVASRIGISPSYYSEMEKGRKSIPESSEFIRKLASALEFNDWLAESAIGFQKQVNSQVPAGFEEQIKGFVERTGDELLFPMALARLEEERQKLTRLREHSKTAEDGSNEGRIPESDEISTKAKAKALSDEISRRQKTIIQTSELDFNDRVSSAMEAAKQIAAIVKKHSGADQETDESKQLDSRTQTADELLETILDVLIDAMFLRGIADEALKLRRGKS